MPGVIGTGESELIKRKKNKGTEKISASMEFTI